MPRLLLALFLLSSCVLGARPGPKIGVIYSSRCDEPGVVVTDIQDNARDAGIEVGDRILEINGVTLVGDVDVSDALIGRAEGEVVDVVLMRDGSELTRAVPVYIGTQAGFEMGSCDDA